MSESIADITIEFNTVEDANKYHEITNLENILPYEEKGSWLDRTSLLLSNTFNDDVGEAFKSAYKDVYNVEASSCNGGVLNAKYMLGAGGFCFLQEYIQFFSKLPVKTAKAVEWSHEYIDNEGNDIHLIYELVNGCLEERQELAE
jgi:hypothetical protein